MSMAGRAKREGHLLDFRSRYDGAENTAHEREELDLARDERVERRWVAALDVVVFRMDLRLDPSPGLRSNRRPHFSKAPMQRARRRLVMVLGEAVRGDTGPGRAYEERRGPECRVEDERPACQIPARHSRGAGVGQPTRRPFMAR